jgi:hypothetical protein
MPIALTGFRGLDYANAVLLDAEFGGAVRPLRADELERIERFVIRLAGADDIDSSAALMGDWFEWPAAMQDGGRAAHGVRITLKDSDLPPGSYQGWLIVYDPDHPDGTPWDTVNVGIKDI